MHIAPQQNIVKRRAHNIKKQHETEHRNSKRETDMQT